MSERQTSHPVVVMKFGGTSVGSRAGRAALTARVGERLAAGVSPVVVVSAMGRSGDPYATDTLLALLEEFDPVPREADLLASCGEVISAVVVAHELRDAGVCAMAFTGGEAGVVSDGTFGAASILAVDPSALRAALDRGVVPVVTGFQAISPDGEVTTLGRGGSDTTACALGAALAADAVEIYTDVDGVMTADPRACGEARVLNALQFEELFQMARAGAKVVHAPAAELAMAASVPVWVRNTFSSAPGTVIATARQIAEERGERVATAVSHSTGVVRAAVDLASREADTRMQALTRVFQAMADSSVSLDMFTPCGDTLVFSFSEEELDVAASVLEEVGLPYDVERGLAKVTLVGAGMHGVPGVMARVAEALRAADVDILQVADSHYTISVLVAQADAGTAIQALHRAFALGE